MFGAATPPSDAIGVLPRYWDILLDSHAFGSGQWLRCWNILQSQLQNLDRKQLIDSVLVAICAHKTQKSDHNCQTMIFCIWKTCFGFWILKVCFQCLLQAVCLVCLWHSFLSGCKMLCLIFFWIVGFYA